MDICSGTFWLVLSRRQNGYWLGHHLKGRLTKSEPTLEAHERAVKLEVKVPAAVFNAPPLVLKVEAEERHVLTPNFDEFIRGLTDEELAAVSCRIADVQAGRGQ